MEKESEEEPARGENKEERIFTVKTEDLSEEV